MRIRYIVVAACLFALACSLISAWLLRPAVGQSTRPPWRTSRIQGTPEPPLPYTTSRRYSNLTFDKPVSLVLGPAFERWYVVEIGGKIWSFAVDGHEEEPKLFLDLKQLYPTLGPLYSIAFHPRFEETREFFLVFQITVPSEDGGRLSRFTVEPTDSLAADLGSEVPLMKWATGGHEGTALLFGPDGYLYLSIGDTAGPWPADYRETGQDISDKLASILRIDVDDRSAGREYGAPVDNPFVDLDGADADVWAYGFRNPWKMSFDRETGELWMGDVGSSFWEEVNRIEKGGNYGWSLFEGSQPFDHTAEKPALDTRPGSEPAPELKRGPTPVRHPLLALEHTGGAAASVTAGFVYRGTELPELGGAFIFGDYSLGKIWGLREELGKPSWFEQLAATNLGIVAFAEDQSGELLVVDYGGTIHGFEKNAQAGANVDFPRQLSQTGLFASVRDLTPAAGVVPYTVNAEMWSDGARAERLLCVPGDQGRIDLGVYRPPDAMHVEYRYPEGSVLAKTLSLEMTVGQPLTARRLETQLLHLQDGTWRAYSYRWNDSQDDAQLVDSKGESMTLTVNDPAAPGGTRQQRWRFASQAECRQCHNQGMGFVLAFNYPQLNKTSLFGEVRGDQLATLQHLGLVRDKEMKERVKDKWFRRSLVDPRDEQADLNERARSYLHVNCAHCHSETEGYVPARFDYELNLLDTATANAVPAQGEMGIDGGRIIAPGSPFQSVLFYRMAKEGTARMPLLGSSVVDEMGLELMHEWIAAMPATPGDVRPADSGDAEEAAQVEALIDSPGDSPSRSVAIGELLDSVSGSLAAGLALQRGEFPETTGDEILDVVASGRHSWTEDLLARFLPPSRRRPVLGLDFDPVDVLSLRGVAPSGRRLFLDGKGACLSCHRVGDDGSGTLGPDLAGIGGQYQRSEILQHITEPSLAIRDGYVSCTVTSSAGVQSGSLVSIDPDFVTLRDAAGLEVRIPSSSITDIDRSQESLMMAGLLQSFTAQEAADLVEFLFASATAAN